MDDLLQSHTARTMLANSEFLVMLNQAATDRAELTCLLNISDNQLSCITNVDFGRGLIKCGSAIVPFMDIPQEPALPADDNPPVRPLRERWSCVKI